MEELINKLLPNVVNKIPELGKSIVDTFYMIGISGAISFIFGLILGIILVVTKKGNILENKIIFNVLDKVVNIFRSIPFIILLAAAIPLTRVIVGTAVGTKGALVPLVIGTVPFFTRQIESALSELDNGLIEAAQSMGSSPVEIIFRVYIKESIPNIIRATTITFISLVGLTAMAGSVGGGGLGDLAIRYGYQRFQNDVTFVTIIILLIIVNIIQGIGDFIIKKTTH
ncbi:methionine ABC transporter permease [Clostridium sp. SM-530-WT-3G]|uniref:methionine ABC transporter permease n=1 Tax=Clostridium sp. SM-530-WT-3G TaxID=2725303 RepID=UPI00145D71FF|nr:methionine ABC transporter permease [Clostridium sp. SM-530-WT-3G]NME83188.1 ABC transporter permease [Clostridium sp. SM-530-WT-3G]